MFVSYGLNVLEVLVACVYKASEPSMPGFTV